MYICIIERLPYFVGAGTDFEIYPEPEPENLKSDGPGNAVLWKILRKLDLYSMYAFFPNFMDWLNSKESVFPAIMTSTGIDIVKK